MLFIIISSPQKLADQRKAAVVALRAKKGQIDPGKLKGMEFEMYDSMSEKQLKEWLEFLIKHDSHY